MKKLLKIILILIVIGLGAFYILFRKDINLYVSNHANGNKSLDYSNNYVDYSKTYIEMEGTPITLVPVFQNINDHGTRHSKAELDIYPGKKYNVEGTPLIISFWGFGPYPGWEGNTGPIYNISGNDGLYEIMLVSTKTLGGATLLIYK